MTTSASTPSTALDDALHVAAAVITNRKGELLIARRPAERHQGGLWEFPGGKVEPGESVQQALRRELEEELGIRAGEVQPLIRVRHRYARCAVLLDVWRVVNFRGEPFGREGQPVRWVAPDQLMEYPFPAANHPVVTAVRLPDRYLITPEPEGDSEGFLVRLERCLQRGVRLVQLRAKQLSEGDFGTLAERVVALVHRYGAQILLNAAPESVRALGADGVHLSGERLRSLAHRPLPPPYWVAASCHDEEELALASGIGVDFALLSPVLPTATHPEAGALGWARFRALVERVNFPVYALGGMAERHLPVAKAQGAQGIAAIRGIWGEYEGNAL